MVGCGRDVLSGVRSGQALLSKHASRTRDLPHRFRLGAVAVQQFLRLACRSSRSEAIGILVDMRSLWSDARPRQLPIQDVKLLAKEPANFRALQSMTF